MTKKANDNPLRIILVGASGRMGQEIIKLAAAAPTLKIVGSLDEKSSWNSVSDKKPDVVIDFS